ncbi:MAG: BspA family leucine-rich repeat surface protein [Prevotella sp.]|nr:BspA family leucine-rich repeat surface protein [Prevotella sp.]
MKRRFLLLLAALLVTAMSVQADDAFVVWDATNTTLYFSYGAVPTEGNLWTPAGGSAITATKVWSGTDVAATGYSEPKWKSIVRSTCSKAVFESSFSTVKPTSCYQWFADMGSLTTIEGLTNLNTSLVTNMGYMFNSCQSLTSLDLSKFETSEVTEMGMMFRDCEGLTSIDLSSFNTSKVGNMAMMFYLCSGLTFVDLSSFNASKVTNMNYMFSDCSVLSAISVGENWNTDEVTSSNDMFSSCNALVGEDGTIVGSSTDKTNAHTGTGGYLTKKSVTVAANTVVSDNWATYYKSNVNRQADANTTVYTAAVSGDKMILTEISDKIIKAGQAVILKSSAASITLTSTIDDATGDFTGNVLEGVDVATAQASGNTYYVLGSGSAGIGFYKYEGTLSANKAFYKVAAGSREYFTIEGFSTGIQEMEAVSGKKADVYYDLSGRRLAQPKKGVNIVNGKLVIIK